MSLFSYAAPQRFYFLAGRLIPWFAALAAITCAVGLWLGFVEAPTDFQQGEVYRIIFIHVPSAWMGMFIYLVMAFYAILNLGYRTRLSAMMIEALAPTGALMSAIALWTGSLWGKPTWGTYWAWDARMTSTLILLFMYFGYMALTRAIEDQNRADRAGSILVLVGVVNVPIIYFSVYWWNTLHQGSSVNPVEGSKMATIMLSAMLVMSISAWCYAIAVTLHRVRSIILERESHTQWVKDLRREDT
ncbi:MAG: heme ABC transporter permease CcmC [Lautropia sp.]|nr:heme ABC transporter permease CcmC [Lautropia sp.]